MFSADLRPFKSLALVVLMYFLEYVRCNKSCKVVRKTNKESELKQGMAFDQNLCHHAKQLQMINKLTEN